VRDCCSVAVLKQQQSWPYAPDPSRAVYATWLESAHAAGPDHSRGAVHEPRPPPVAADGISIGPLYPHGRRAEDWYVLTVAVDFLSFIYIALFYQARSFAVLSPCCL